MIKIRNEVIKLLRAKPRTVRNLMDALSASRQAMAYHANGLVKAGLARSERQAIKRPDGATVTVRVYWID